MIQTKDKLIDKIRYMKLPMPFGARHGNDSDIVIRSSVSAEQCLGPIHLGEKTFEFTGYLFFDPQNNVAYYKEDLVEEESGSLGGHAWTKSFDCVELNDTELASYGTLRNLLKEQIETEGWKFELVFTKVEATNKRLSMTDGQLEFRRKIVWYLPSLVMIVVTGFRIFIADTDERVNLIKYLPLIGVGLLINHLTVILKKRWNDIFKRWV